MFHDLLIGPFAEFDFMRRALVGVIALSISGAPLFNGFISKSMIITAAGDEGRGVAELLLTLASIGTFLHTGLKLPYFTFFGPSRGLRLTSVPANMLAAMGVAAACCRVASRAPSTSLTA